MTLAGFWLVVFLFFWWVLPLRARGVWPLLNIVESSTGRQVPDSEGDLFVSVDRAGTLYLDERLATQAELRRAFYAANRPTRGWQDRVYVNEIFVRVDQDAPFGAVRTVILLAQSANVRRLTFLAKPARNPLLKEFH